MRKRMNTGFWPVLFVVGLYFRMHIILPYLATLVCIAVLDLLWLGIVMKDFYRANLGHLMSGGVVWPAAIIFYVIYAAGLMYFAAIPGIASGSLLRTMLMGAALGAFAYMTYDLTNQATLKDWPLAVTVIDIIWGAFISGVAASIAYLVAKMLG